MFSHLFNQKVDLKRLVGVDEYGVPTFGEQKSIACRIEYVNTLVIGTSGREVTSTATIFTNDDLKIGDVLYFAGQDHTVQQVVFDVGLDGEYSVNRVYVV